MTTTILLGSLRPRPPPPLLDPLPFMRYSCLNAVHRGLQQSRRPSSPTRPPYLTATSLLELGKICQHLLLMMTEMKTVLNQTTRRTACSQFPWGQNYWLAHLQSFFASTLLFSPSLLIAQELLVSAHLADLIRQIEHRCRCWMLVSCLRSTDIVSHEQSTTKMTR